MSVELPKDAEGREIPLDTMTLYTKDGAPRDIANFVYYPQCAITEREWTVAFMDGSEGFVSQMYLTPPDSWEKLEEDLSEAGDARYYEACAYFHRDKDEGGCISCPGGEDGCGRIAMRDILARIRKLRGEDE